MFNGHHFHGITRKGQGIKAIGIQHQGTMALVTLPENK